MQITDHPSANFGPRKDGLTPSLVVLHYTAMQSCDAARDRLCDPQAEVSAHYLISRYGQILRLVGEDQRAWHAGAGSWGGLDDINSRSIGIELDNGGSHPFAAAQMNSLEGLLKDILNRWSISRTGVIGHSDMAPTRKSDPGAHFDWERLERQGLAAARGRGAGPQDATQTDFRQLAIAWGYSGDLDDETLLQAVRLRFRPWATGPLNGDDFTPLGHTAKQT
jgi:N-acetylmuramoyl-L-alanine amidase